MGFIGFIGIFQQNLLMQLKQVRRNILLVLIPVAVFFFVYLFFNANDVANDFLSPISMAVIDEDDTPYSDMLIESFRDNESFSKFVQVVEGTDTDLLKQFEDRTIDVMITVPEGFIEGLASTEALPLDVSIHYDDPVKAILFRNVILSYEKYIRSVEAAVILIDDEMRNIGIEREIRYSWRDRSLVNLIFIALARNEFFGVRPQINVPSVVAVRYYFVSLMVMFLMYISIFAAINLIREKKDMCLSRIHTTRLSMLSYIGAKAMADVVYIMLILIVWLSGFVLFYGQPWDANGVWLLFFLMVCVFFNVSVAMFFSSFFDSEEAVVLLSSIFIFFNAVIGGSIIPIHNMPYVIQRMALAAPNYWMIRGFLFLDHSYEMKQIFFVAIGLLITGVGMITLTAFLQNREVR